MDERRSRRSMLAAAGAAVLVAGCGASPAPPAAQPRGGRSAAPGDLEILSFALSLEYLESSIYARVVDAGILSGRDLERAKVFGEHERQHVDAIEATIRKLGGTRPDRPSPDFDAILSGGPDAVLGRLAQIEDVGAAAYLGQAARIQDDEILSAALSIHAVEARHAASLNRRVGRSFTPTAALAAPLDREEVLELVARFTT